MNISKSINAKLVLVIASTSFIVISAIMSIEALGTKRLVSDQIRQAAETEADLAYMGIEKPMTVGDNKSTIAEFATIKDKFTDLSAHMISYSGNTTYSTDNRNIRKDFSSMFKNDTLISLVNEGLKNKIRKSSFIDFDNKKIMARVISISNQDKCHHCHGSSEPILGEMILLSDVSGSWNSMNKQIITSACIGLSGIIILIGISIWTMRTLIIKKITLLADASSKVASGTYNVSFKVSGQDEIASLAGDIELMVSQLKERLGFSEGVLKGIPLPCAVLSADGKVIWTNQSMCNLLEKENAPESYLGESPGKFFWNDDSHKTNSEKAIETKQPQASEFIWHAPSGKDVHVAVNATPFFDMDGILIGSITFMRDVTERRTQQQKIEEQNTLISKAANNATLIANHLAKTSEHLLGRISDTVEGSNIQRDRIQTTAVAVDEMNATVLEVARNASDASKNAEDARDRALDGQAITNQSVEFIMNVLEQTKKMTNSLHTLGEQANGIGHIMIIISDIADQTNLLALNAAIEAARAGDAGRGFAVVADEVRKLAEKTMNATKEVAVAVHGIQDGAKLNITLMESVGKNVEQGATLVTKVGESLSSIRVASISTADMVRSIATAAEQQSSASDEISQNVSEVNLIAQQTASNMEELAQTSKEVSQAASELQDVIGVMSNDSTREV